MKRRNQSNAYYAIRDHLAASIPTLTQYELASYARAAAAAGLYEARSIVERRTSLIDTCAGREVTS